MTEERKFANLYSASEHASSTKNIICIPGAAEYLSNKISGGAVIEPMECLAVANLPDGPGWVYEINATQ
jgi:hypothetical protein